MKRALVTGSSRGIGRAIALRLAQEGWSIASHYSTRADEAMSLAERLGDKAAGIYQADLSDPAAASLLWSQALAEGELHALVNNAGIYLPKSFLETSPSEIQQLFRVNWESPLMLTQLAASTFSESGGGKILNVASRAGYRGEPGAAIYAATKAALINLTHSLAVELSRYNIGVFGIAPGWVDTSMARDGMEARLTEILASIPLGRMASPEDCASVAAFLLSDDGAYMVGQVLDINGASYFH
jgi:3-oxoacyl-[acyl-carrier protein] reductase